MTSVTSQTKANCFKWIWKTQRILSVQSYPYHLPVPWLTGASEWSLGIMAQIFLVTAFKSVLHSSTVVYLNKNALTASVSLACLETRSRNEEAINSTQNTIYSLKVFFASYFIDVDTFFCFWIDLVCVLTTTGNNVCCRRLYAYINTQKFKGLDSRQRTSLPEIKKVIYMAHHFQSSPKINRMLITRPICIQ